MTIRLDLRSPDHRHIRPGRRCGPDGLPNNATYTADAINSLMWCLQGALKNLLPLHLKWNQGDHSAGEFSGINWGRDVADHADFIGQIAELVQLVDDFLGNRCACGLFNLIDTN